LKIHLVSDVAELVRAALEPAAQLTSSGTAAA
jgi:hypothetical protein